MVCRTFRLSWVGRYEFDLLILGTILFHVDNPGCCCWMLNNIDAGWRIILVGLDRGFFPLFIWMKLITLIRAGCKIIFYRLCMSTRLLLIWGTHSDGLHCPTIYEHLPRFPGISVRKLRGIMNADNNAPLKHLRAANPSERDIFRESPGTISNSLGLGQLTKCHAYRLGHLKSSIYTIYLPSRELFWNH